MSKKRLMIYPFSPHSIAYVRCRELLKDYALGDLICPSAWIGGKTSSEVIGNLSTEGIQIHTDFSMYLSQNDAVLFLDGNYTPDFRCHLLEMIQCAVEAKKDIISNLKLTAGEQADLEKSCDFAGVQFYNLKLPSEAEEHLASITELYTPSVPVIYVGELLEQFQAAETVFYLTKLLSQAGYRVASVTEDESAPLFGMYSTPRFLRSKGLSEQEKMVYLSCFIKTIDQIEVPDVIVIQIPGSLMKFNEKLFYDFGIYCFYYSNILTPDYFICTTSYNLTGTELFQTLSKNFQVKYGFGIDAAMITNMHLDMIKLMNNNIFDVDWIPAQKAEKLAKELSAEDSEILVGTTVSLESMKQVVEDFCELSAQEELMIL